mgnify:FL=1
MNGFLNLYKPKGVSSAKILNTLKKSVRGVSVGHMGTLEPLASGVLPVALGKSTRMFDYLLDKDKVYIATFAFGYETNTLDLEGEIVKKHDKIPTESELIEKSKELVGDIMQIPPVFSAKCVNGKRSYQLARKGHDFELPPKKVRINSITLIEKISDNEFKFEISCKGGTYIRSIVRDLAALCGTVGTMTDLIRTKSGVFEIENSVKVEDFISEENKDRLLIAPENVVNYPEIKLTEREAARLYNGLYDTFPFDDGVYKVFAPDGFYGIGEVNNGKIKVKAYIRS